jgi:hypothetical protein
MSTAADCLHGDFPSRYKRQRPASTVEFTVAKTKSRAVRIRGYFI